MTLVILELMLAVRLMTDHSNGIYQTLGVSLSSVDNMPQFCNVVEAALNTFVVCAYEHVRVLTSLESH